MASAFFWYQQGVSISGTSKASGVSKPLMSASLWYQHGSGRCGSGVPIVAPEDTVSGSKRPGMVIDMALRKQLQLWMFNRNLQLID
jgi:hypothetical protein